MKMLPLFIVFTILVSAFAAPTADFIVPVGIDPYNYYPMVPSYVFAVAREARQFIGTGNNVGSNTNVGGNKNLASNNNFNSNNQLTNSKSPSVSLGVGTV